MALFQHLLQGRLVDQAAARAVDDSNSGLGLREILARQYIAGLVGERRVERDEIGAREQGVELDLLHPHVERPLRRQERIVGDHLHPEPQRPVGDDRADIAGADQAQCLARQLDAHEPVLLPFAVLGGAVGLGQLARQREHQSDGMFGGGYRIAERRVHDDDAAGRRGGDVDIVDADTGPTDDLEIGRRVEDVGRHLRRGADGKAIIVANDRLQFVLGEAGPLVDLDPIGSEDRGGVRIHGIGNQHFRHLMLRELREFRPSASGSGRSPGRPG